MTEPTRRLHAPGWRDRLREPRALAMIAGAVLVAALAVVALGGAPGVPEVTGLAPTPAPSAVAGSASPSATLSAADRPETMTVPPSVRPVETSAPVSAPPPATPWPTPDPAIWRFEGTVVDERGAPLEGVCVVIGPTGCVRGSLRTDRNGRFYVDMEKDSGIRYTFTFLRPGYEAVVYRTQVSGPTVFNVILRRV